MEHEEEHEPHRWPLRPDQVMSLHAGLARVEERLRHVIDRLETHMTDEHADFRDTLSDMKTLRKEVQAIDEQLKEIHTSAKVTRWIIAAAAAIITWLLALGHGLAEMFRR